MPAAMVALVVGAARHPSSILVQQEVPGAMVGGLARLVRQARPAAPAPRNTRSISWAPFSIITCPTRAGPVRAVGLEAGLVATRAATAATVAQAAAAAASS